MSNKGSTITVIPIITVAVFLIFISFVVNFVEMMEPFIVYEKLSSISLKYIFIMEEYGFLTEQEKNELKKEIGERGLNENKIMIDATDTLQSYGEPVSIKINYTHEMNLPEFSNSIIPMMKSKKMNINVEKKSFSKR